jgi:hypothetical protein
VSHTRRLSYMHSHTRLMETHPSVTGIKHYRIESYMMRTCLSSLSSSETTLKLIIIFLSNLYHIYILLSYVKIGSSIISQLTT